MFCFCFSLFFRVLSFDIAVLRPCLGIFSFCLGFFHIVFVVLFLACLGKKEKIPELRGKNTILLLACESYSQPRLSSGSMDGSDSTWTTLSSSTLHLDDFCPSSTAPSFLMHIICSCVSVTSYSLFDHGSTRCHSCSWNNTVIPHPSSPNHLPHISSVPR